MRWVSLAATLGLFAAATSCGEETSEPLDAEQPLRDYVRRPDESYGWKEIGGGRVGPSEYIEAQLTSQTWRGQAWRHRLFVIRPSTAPADVSSAILVIAGGSWRDSDARQPLKLPPDAAVYGTVAEKLAAPVVVLMQVPFQPLYDGKREDALIAHTFRRFMETGDPSWPLLLPMTKAAVRGMDAAEEICASKWKLEIQQFTVTGASKRGWTTWLTAAVDNRVQALAPMVIDMLNLEKQLPHQKAVWGKPSAQIGDYTRLRLDEQIRTPRGQELAAIVDPHAYRSQIQQPKLIILGANDPYWPVDASNLYWPSLEGPKHLLHIPNNGHGLTDFPRLIGSIVALHRAAGGGPALPRLDWEWKQASPTHVRLVCDQRPRRVRLWVAESERRDFRQSRFESQTLDPDADGAYAATIQPLPDRFQAAFVEAQFGRGDDYPLCLSTTVRVIEPSE